MNHSILLQLTAPALLTSLVLIGTSIGSAWSIHRLQANLVSIQAENVTSLHAALDLERVTRQLRYHSALYLMRPGRERLALIETDERNFVEAFQRAEESANTQGEAEFLKQIDQGYHLYRDEMARMRAEVDRKGPITDFPAFAATHPIRHISDSCQGLGRLNNEQLARTIEESRLSGERSRLVLLFLGIAAPVGGLIAGYGIARALQQSIARLSVRVRDVVDRLDREGESRDDFQLTVTTDTDLSSLDRQLQQAVVRIEELVARSHKQQSEMRRAEQLASAGQLAAGVAHEVRNPLTGMKLLVEAAIRPSRPRPLTSEDLEVIHEEITRLEEIVQSFLDFARPPALSRSMVDLREVVNRPLELVRTRARQQQVTLEVSCPAEALPVNLDGGQFRAVLVNLLINGLDAMPNGGELSVKLTRFGERIQLRVCDTGPGIASEVRGRLFTPFCSTKATGTGLGLSLSRRIVEEHGGQIRVEDSPGGACFLVDLPLAEEVSHAAITGR